MPSDFPGSIHDSPLDDISLSTLKTKKTNDATYDHATEHVSHVEEIIATQTKIGTGSSTPVTNSFLMGNGTGTSAWDTSPTLNNNQSISWLNAASSSSSSIEQNASDEIVIDSPDGNIRFSNANVGFNVVPEARVHANSGTTDLAGIFESTDTTVVLGLKDGTTTGNAYVGIQADGDVLSLRANNLPYLSLQPDGRFRVKDATLADYFEIYHNGTNVTLSTGGTGGGDIRFEAAGADVAVRDGGRFLTQDSTNSDNVTISHDGSNGIISTGGAGGGNLTLQPAGNVHVSGGGRLRAFDTGGGGGSLYVDIYHDGTNGIIDSATGDLRFTAAGADVQVRDGSDFEVYGPTNAGKILIEHDDTNGQIFTDAGKIILNADNNQVTPDADNDTTLGTASFRWSDVRAVLVNGADIALQNGFLFREYPCTEEDVHTKSVEWMMEHANAGVQMLNQDGEVICIFGKNGTLYVDEIKPLSEAAKDLLT